MKLLGLKPFAKAFWLTGRFGAELFEVAANMVLVISENSARGKSSVRIEGKKKKKKPVALCPQSNNRTQSSLG